MMMNTEIKTAMGKEALQLAMRFVQVLDSKQQDYGSDNILISGELGVVVRAQDKLCRLRHLLKKNGEVNHEGIDDSWMDLANYGIIGHMLHNGVWR
tara:strand:+ start:25587 stop:25874 length:288 start_codon:yes stop_codon:yes gene_type:complete